MVATNLTIKVEDTAITDARAQLGPMVLEDRLEESIEHWAFEKRKKDSIDKAIEGIDKTDLTNLFPV